MERPLLIASDIDGTLLNPLAKLSERTARVVARAADADVPLVLASGRPPRWIPTVAEAAGVTGYAVCTNGAVIYDIGADRVVEVRGVLDPVLLGDLVKELETAVPGALFAAERVGVSAIDPEVESYVYEEGYQNPWGDGEGIEVPRAEVLGHPAVKLLVRHREMTSTEMAAAAKALLGDLVEITFSSNSGLLEIHAKDMTKATGLAWVADRLGVPPGRVITFGDMPNDVEMLRWAGHGVAMANAHALALEAADEITGPNSEDGVAQVLERWF